VGIERFEKKCEREKTGKENTKTNIFIKLLYFLVGWSLWQCFLDYILLLTNHGVKIKDYKILSLTIIILMFMESKMYYYMKFIESTYIYVTFISRLVFDKNIWHPFLWQPGVKGCSRNM